MLAANLRALRLEHIGQLSTKDFLDDLSLATNQKPRVRQVTKGTKIALQLAVADKARANRFLFQLTTLILK